MTQYAVAMDRIESTDDSCRVPDGPVGTIRWVNVATARYYEATLQLNLFRECEVHTVWGGVGSPRGGHQCHPVSNPAAGVELVAAIARTRQKRGYERSGLDAYTLALAVQLDELRSVVGEVMVSLR